MMATYSSIDVVSDCEVFCTSSSWISLLCFLSNLLQLLGFDHLTLERLFYDPGFDEGEKEADISLQISLDLLDGSFVGEGGKRLIGSVKVTSIAGCDQIDGTIFTTLTPGKNMIEMNTLWIPQPL
jgi:hypothetical protein